MRLLARNGRNHKRIQKRPLIQNDSSSLTSQMPSRTEVSSRPQMSMPDHDRQPFGGPIGPPVDPIHSFISAAKMDASSFIRPPGLSHLVERLLVRHLDPLQQLDGVLGALEARALDAEVVPQLLDAPLDRVPEHLASAVAPRTAPAAADAADVVLAVRRVARRLLVVLERGETKTTVKYVLFVGDGWRRSNCRRARPRPPPLPSPS